MDQLDLVLHLVVVERGHQRLKGENLLADRFFNNFNNRLRLGNGSTKIICILVACGFLFGRFIVCYFDLV